LITVSTRRALVALATAAVLLPTAPALAQTATPTVPIGPTPTPTATPAPSPSLTDLSVSRSVIDFGQTVDVTVRGTAGAAVDLLLGNARLPQFRVIRTATIGTNGSFTWTGLRPEDTSNLIARFTGTNPSADGPSTTVRVRRTVTIGIQQRTRGTYTFTGQIARAEAGVQVTVARLDDQTKRVTGVASTRTTADGRYTISTALPQGLAGYYALTEAANGLDAGRSRLYGLLVNTTPGAPSAPAPTTQSVSLDVGRSSGNVYVFSGAVSPGRSVPVTLARVVGGRLIGVAGGRSAANGGYVFRVPVASGTHFFQVVTATARSRVYGLTVAAAPVAAPPASPVVTPPSSGGSVFYENCDAVRRAGAAPIRRGDPGYRAGLDGDGDGVACASD
jgi:hypothetical protein